MPDSTATCMVLVDRSLGLTPAVARAAALARKGGERLLLASFEFERGLARAAARGFDLDAYLRGRRAKLELLAGGLRHGGLVVDAQLAWSHPVLASALRAILATRPHRVVKDVRAEPLLKRVLFTPEDLDLLRQCPAPLMLVRSGARELPRRILAAVDPLDAKGRPHELNARVLQAAKRLAMQCGAELDVVHAFEFVPPYIGPQLTTGWMPDMGMIDSYRALHADALQALGKASGIPAQRLHMLDGMPGWTIAEYAAANRVDVVVMGSIQRGFLQRLSLGSVAESLLQRLDCDVLALKPQGFSARLHAELAQGGDVGSPA